MVNFDETSDNAWLKSSTPDRSTSPAGVGRASPDNNLDSRTHGERFGNKKDVVIFPIAYLVFLS